MNFQDFLDSHIDQILLSEDEIEHINRRLAYEISTQYAGKSLVLIGIMRGCIPFISDLAKYIPLSISLEYIRISMYTNIIKDDDSKINILPLNEFDLREKNVILIDEILDRGVTLKMAYDWVAEQKPASLKTCVFIERMIERPFPIKADFTGYELHSDQWVIGYGCDYQHAFRHLPYLATLKPDSFNAILT